MKHYLLKISFIIFTLILFPFQLILAATPVVYHEQINWKGIEKQTYKNYSTEILAFENAGYPEDNHIPYFVKTLNYDPSHNISSSLSNKIYQPLTPAETALVSQYEIAENEEIKQSVITGNGNTELQLCLMPFVRRGNKILRLVSFDLTTTDLTDSPLKVSTASTRSYAENSVLANGRFVKLKITDSGIYRLNYETLVSMGVDPNNVNIFGYGGAIMNQDFTKSHPDDLPEVPIYIYKGSDNVFNAGDYILFYGQGINKWTYNAGTDFFTHTINPYSSYGYYFVTSDAGTGRRIELKNLQVPDNAKVDTIRKFVDYQVHEKEAVNIIESGRCFYGESYSTTNTYSFTFNTPNPISSRLRLSVISTSLKDMTFLLYLNGESTQLFTASKRANNVYTYANTTTPSIFSFSSPTENSIYTLTLNKTSTDNDGYLDFIEVNTTRYLKMSGKVMQFQNTSNIGKGLYNNYQLSNATSNIKIFDITQPDSVFMVPTSYNSGLITFTASGNELHNYIAIDPTSASSFNAPSNEGVVTNQNIHSITQADYVIITPVDFLSQANELAEFHQTNDNLSTAVVTTNQIYNEFSSGTPDASAYRWFVKMLYDRAIANGNKSDAPKYLLLFGKGSYDNRKLLSGSGNNNILTYQSEESLVTTTSYVSDDYFGLLDDSEGTNLKSNLLDIGIGRIPASSSTQASVYVSKLKSYSKNEIKGKWKNQLCFVADDGDNSTHVEDADTVCNTVCRTFPAYQASKIYLDSYVQETTASGEKYPVAKSQLLNSINSGLLLLNYNGHAGTTGWSNEGILSMADIKGFSNTKLPFVYGATCDFLQFDGSTESGGEQFLLNATGGCIGIISAARPVYAQYNRMLDRAFDTRLFAKSKGQNLRIGDVLPAAKNSLGSSDDGNKLSYIYMGDPALKLNFPTDYQVLATHINNDSVNKTDTLNALSKVTIRGIVADSTGAVATTFNGNVNVVVFDKNQKLTTLNNDNETGGNFSYYYRPNKLFSGEAEVKNGYFSISFIMPKDMKYNYGTGRINFYASDQTHNTEAQGYFEKFIIGGSENTTNTDTIGPDVNIYLNSTQFINGGKVNESPYFIAEIADEHGINTIGSGIGHDIVLTLDNDNSQSYTLNDYYSANANSYTRGSILYKLSDLEEGNHSLTFKVWDLLNNSTKKSLNFRVIKGLAPTIFNTYVYPNPVYKNTSAQIVIQNDRPETVLKTSVDIFDITGRKVWSFTQNTAGNIVWDLSTSNGLKANTGVYIYKVTVQTNSSEVTTKSNKFFIVEQ